MIVLSWIVCSAALYLTLNWAYRHYRAWWMSPLLVLLPLLLIAVLQALNGRYPMYFGVSHWPALLLGPAVIAFAVPVYEYRALIRQHWMSLLSAVLVGTPVAVLSSITLARLFHLAGPLQQRLAPFALPAAEHFGTLPQLTVVITGVCGVMLGEAMLALLPVRSKLQRSPGATRPEQGVVASLIMMLGGIAMVAAAPLVTLIV
jgi:putative effector of murein hydrolase